MDTNQMTIKKLQDDIKHLKFINHLLRNRSDLPIERIRRYDEVVKKLELLENIFKRCRIMVWPGNNEYPIEHNPYAHKYNRVAIELELEKVIKINPELEVLRNCLKDFTSRNTNHQYTLVIAGYRDRIKVLEEAEKLNNSQIGWPL